MTYTCEITYGSTKLEANPKVDIIVLSATTVTAFPTGSNQTFTCGYTGAQANYNVTWSGVTGDVTNTATTETAGTSTIAVMDIKADVTVTCTIGDAVATIPVDIYGKC